MKLLGFKERYSEAVGEMLLSRNKRDYLVAPFPGLQNASYSKCRPKFLARMRSYRLGKAK